MTTIFSDGFESGDFSAWSSASGASGTSRSVCEAGAFHGDYGCRVDVDGSAPAYADSSVVRQFTASYSEFYVRFYFRVLSAADWARTIDVFLLGSFWSHPHFSCQKSGDRYRLQMFTFHDGGNWSYASEGPLFGLGQRVCVEGYFKLATAPGANDGILRHWQDGRLVAELTSVDNDTMSPSDRVAIYNYNVVAPFEAEMEYDDVAVATERIYPLRGYRVYHNDGVGPVDYDTVRETLSEYAEDWTSPALDYPATWRFGVRAYNEYGTENNVNIAAEFVLLDSGDESPARPNSPAGLAARAVSGGKVELTWDYDATDEEATCTHFHVYADGGSGEIDYTSPIGSVDVDDGVFTHYTFLTGALGDGLTVRFAVQAATAGEIEDTGTTWVETVTDAAAPDQPDTLAGTVVR
jgi:hypothetical protein